MIVVDAEEGASNHAHLACRKTTCIDDYFYRFNFIIDIQAS
ncbi:hypothetical protein [Terrisporobacter glycolicus]|nr:hypothetical protein [Terrisporobacter glycolicus]